VHFLLLGQPGEFGVQGMIAVQKRLLAMEDRRVCAGGVIEAVDLARPERELDAAPQDRVRIGLEIGIGEVRNLASVPVQFDRRGAVKCAQVGPRASLVERTVRSSSSRLFTE
jgi:hypothetical protein